MDVFARLCLVALVALALMTPRMAWAVHQIGHAPVSLSEVHHVDIAHADDHGHDHDTTNETDRDDASSDGTPKQEPVHSHGGLVGLAALDLPPAQPDASVWVVDEALGFNLSDPHLTSAGITLQERPPRFA